MIISIEKNLVSRYNTEVRNYNTEIHVSVRKNQTRKRRKKQ